MATSELEVKFPWGFFYQPPCIIHIRGTSKCRLVQSGICLVSFVFCVCSQLCIYSTCVPTLLLVLCILCRAISHDYAGGGQCHRVMYDYAVTRPESVMLPRSAAGQQEQNMTHAILNVEIRTITVFIHGAQVYSGCIQQELCILVCTYSTVFDSETYISGCLEVQYYQYYTPGLTRITSHGLSHRISGIRIQPCNP